jgi:hypothetical protein
MLEDFDQVPGREKRRPRPGVLGPWLTGLVLAGTLALTIASAPREIDVTAYYERVAGRVQGVPYAVGSYVGRDVEVVPAARELLKPNAVLQRRYRNLNDGSWFDVIVVHCGDVRDMQGHYPPVCYPAAGWEIDRGEPTSAAVSAQGVPATEYRVEFIHDRSVPPMRIVNFFALPGAGVQYARDMRVLEGVARSGARAQMGVLQVQVLTPASMDEAARAALMPRVWGVIEPVVREVVEGPDAEL